MSSFTGYMIRCGRLRSSLIAVSKPKRYAVGYLDRNQSRVSEIACLRGAGLLRNARENLL
jgi:hypothetical protein